MKRCKSGVRALRPVQILIAAGALLALAACDNRAGNGTAGEKIDAAVAKTEDATIAAARKAAELAETARDKTKAYIDSPQARQDAAAVKDAFKGAASAIESTAEDASITASISAAIARDPELSARRIDVDTQRGAVHLKGSAPTQDAKARAEVIAKGVTGVASVDNQLSVTAN